MPPAPRPALRPSSTTLCRVIAVVGLLGPEVALAAEPPPATSEATLVAEALTGPVAAARLEAISARSAAAGTAPSVLANPFLEGRHEEARGPAGASTDALTASWTLDLGFSGLAAGDAASASRAALEGHQRAAVAEVVCEVRRASLDLWAADSRRLAVEEAHERLERLVTRLGEMSEAGEVAGYDVARVHVADAVHRADRDRAIVEAERARAALGALVGARVAAVSLLPVVPHPALSADAADLAQRDPVLTALLREVEAAEARVAAAQRAAVPDLVVFGGARRDAPPGTRDTTLGWEAGAAIEVPAFTRNQPAIAEAEADVSEARAAATEREALLRAERLAAASLLAALGELPLAPPEDLWEGAVARYQGSESSIDELLVVAEAVESARIARIDGEHLRRGAHLGLACALADFPEPELRTVFEEALR